MIILSTHFHGRHIKINLASTHIGCGFGVLDKSECLQISITNSKPNGASSVSILNTTTQWGGEGGERVRERRKEGILWTRLYKLSGSVHTSWRRRQYYQTAVYLS